MFGEWARSVEDEVLATLKERGPLDLAALAASLKISPESALLFLGIPIGWAEWTMGKYGGRKGFRSAPSILGVFGKGAVARYLGVLGVLVPLAVSFYYTYIEAWCLGYFWHYLTGGIGVDAAAPIAEQTTSAAQFYSELTGRAENGIMTGGTFETFIFWVITFAVNIWLVFRGISKGIEKFCSCGTPA